MQRANIEYAKMQMSAKEEKAGNGDGENGEENEENGEEEEEGEDFEEKIRDMQDKLQEILSGIDEGRDGKLPDTVVIQLRTYLLLFLFIVARFTKKYRPFKHNIYIIQNVLHILI